MLLNPSRDKEALLTYPGTRLLHEGFDVLGWVITESMARFREWRVEAFYSPLGRALGGVRARLCDPQGFVTFCNQRDLEVLLKVDLPGTTCNWLGEKYPDEDDPSWVGLCADFEDLQDDLHERELGLRAQSANGWLEPGIELRRFVHAGWKDDYVETFTFVSDFDEVTGLGPDPRLATLSKRWRRIERKKILWTQKK